MPLPATLAKRLRLSLIAAPMFRVSGPELVTAACRNGVIGSFPTANCRSIDELDAWLRLFGETLDASHAPFCPNLIMRRENLAQELECLLKHKVELVITSVGSPAPVVKPLHDIGCLVLADVATVRHAEKAIEAGVDGLILLTAGAGGQTGWANGFAFARAVRAMYDGIIVMAGGISDGAALWSAQTLGCDLAYMGTKFIATSESMASDGYKDMLLNSRLDDVMTTHAFTGLDTNFLRPSIIAAGLDPDNLPANVTSDRAAALYGGKNDTGCPRRWRDIWGAGHSVSGIDALFDVAGLINKTQAEYEDARKKTVALLTHAA